MDQRDRTAEFVGLYRSCEVWLYGYLLSLLQRPADAEEVLQQTACICWEKFDQYRPGTEFRAWACRIAYLKALKFRAERKKAAPSFSDLFIEAVDEEAVVMADVLDARLAHLDSCVEQLPEADRRLLRLRYTAGATVKSVAAALGRSVHVVYRSLARIHESLHRCVELAMKEESDER